MKVREPWDLERGDRFDVFKNAARLDRELELAELAHFAPNCGTFSRARERPIKGVKFPPKPLRSDSFPEGLPGLSVAIKRESITTQHVLIWRQGKPQSDTAQESLLA